MAKGKERNGREGLKLPKVNQKPEWQTMPSNSNHLGWRSGLLGKFRIEIIQWLFLPGLILSSCSLYSSLFVTSRDMAEISAIIVYHYMLFHRIIIAKHLKYMKITERLFKIINIFIYLIWRIHAYKSCEA